MGKHRRTLHTQEQTIVGIDYTAGFGLEVDDVFCDCSIDRDHTEMEAEAWQLTHS